MSITITSLKLSLNKQDIQKWLKNTLIFACPAVLLSLASFQDLIPKDSIDGIIWLFVINVVIDLIKKWLAETDYTTTVVESCKKKVINSIKTKQ